LAAGAYQFAGGADGSVIEGLLIAAIACAGVLYLPMLIATRFLDVAILLQPAAIIVPAAVHLVYFLHGNGGKYWACDIADIVIGGFILVFGLGYTRVLVVP
jgi:hypothetical protein